MKIIDTPWNTTNQIQCLINEGVGTVIRYYNIENSHHFPQKRLEQDEAEKLSDNGIRIAVVFQIRQTEREDFTEEKGKTAGTSAYSQAEAIGQSHGSAIYFAVDYDATVEDIQNNITPYFKGVTEVFGQMGGDYKIGVYGSGTVCNTLKSNGLCEFRWLSMSEGFLGTREALHNGDYELAQKSPATTLCGLSVDFDEINPEIDDFGSFILGESSLA